MNFITISFYDNTYIYQPRKIVDAEKRYIDGIIQLRTTLSWLLVAIKSHVAINIVSVSRACPIEILRMFFTINKRTEGQPTIFIQKEEKCFALIGPWMSMDVWKFQ